MEHSPRGTRHVAGLAARTFAQLPFGSVVGVLVLTAAAIAAVICLGLLLVAAPEPLISAPVRW